jgi:hypothetical protein
MSATLAIAGNLHAVALEAAYARLVRSSTSASAWDSEIASSRLRQLSETFSLSPLEENLLLLAAARELAPSIQDARVLFETAAAISPDAPTVESAFEILGTACDWLSFRNILRDDSPLLHWRLLSLSHSGDPLPTRTLRADPRIVDFLLGGDLAGVEASRAARWFPAPTHAPSAVFERPLSLALRQLETFLLRPASRRLFFVLSSGSPEEQEEFAQAVLGSIGMPLLAMNAALSPAERTIVLRESLLARTALLVHDLPSPDADWYTWLVQAAPIVFLARPLDDGSEPVACPPSLTAHVWVNVELPPSRRQLRHRLTELAQRIPTVATWDDLILPPDAKSRLQDLCAQAQLQQAVLSTGGFGRKLSRGKAATGLFCGPSGTGKTLAAEVIAHSLDRELYRVDLALIVSKYIGETEKNLRKVFAEAERARSVLFFDEADALFGKRTEVRDSHDRYANLEVSYLLQLFEAAEHTMVLLSSNRREAIDEAFARRFRFVVEFPMPSAALRRELWRTSFSPEIPLAESVRIDILADRLQISGAAIRNIALAAAFLAVADQGGAPGPVSGAHLAIATRRELEKLSSPMPLTAAEISAPVPHRRVP